MNTNTEIFNLSFQDGVKLTISEDIDSDIEYKVLFIDNSIGVILFETIITSGMWAKPTQLYYIPWRIEIYNNNTNEIMLSHVLDLKGKEVYIYFDSSALGDTIAWFPYIEEFRKKHNCYIKCATYHNDFFKNSYPDISFYDPKDLVSYYARYNIAWIQDYGVKNIHDPRYIPLQKTSSDILGLEYKEIKPKFDYNIDADKPLKEKYITISTQSTAHAKYWHRENGWENVVKYLNSIGYVVVCISKNGCDISGVKNVFGLTLQEVSRWIKYSEFFIGLGSGLSWVSWVLDKKVIMISGFSEDWCEFDCIRPKSTSDCTGCFNKYKFDRNKWDWCPVHEYTGKKYMCSKEISENEVINEIKKIVK
jgi:autotransporter strand-loop-strand O-heptosyltransferase